MKHKMLLLILAALLMAVAGSQAQLPDTIWTQLILEEAGDIVGADFTPDGKEVVVAAHHGLFFYDTGTGEFLRKFTKPYGFGRVMNAYFLKNSKKAFLDCAALNWALWDYELEDTVYSIGLDGLFTFSTGKNVIYRVENLTKYISCYDIDTKELIERRTNPNFRHITAKPYASEDGRFIVLRCTYDVYQFGNELYDWETDMLYGLPLLGSNEDQRPTAVDFSKDNRYMAVGDDQGYITIFDLQSDTTYSTGYRTKRIVGRFKSGTSVQTIKFDSNNACVLVGSLSSFYTYVYDMKSFNIIYKYFGPAQTALNINKDNDLIVSTDQAYIYLYRPNHRSVSVPQEEYESVLYPNPTTNIVNISLQLLPIEPINISIYDDQGKQIAAIFDGISDQTDFVWNTEDVPSGVYFCVIKSKISSKSYKIIINK